MSTNYRALFQTWEKLVQLKEKMGRTLLELIAHPDATPEQIAEVAPRYKAVVAMLREHRPKVLAALQTKRFDGVLVQVYADKVRNTRI